jgi:alpha-tubulin suppressor-like RCC1 family protein
MDAMAARAALTVLAVAVAACATEPSYPVAINVAPEHAHLFNRVFDIEVTLLNACGEMPPQVVSAVLLHRGDDGIELARVGPESYGVDVVARDRAGCYVVAACNDTPTAVTEDADGLVITLGRSAACPSDRNTCVAPNRGGCADGEWCLDRRPDRPVEVAAGGNTTCARLARRDVVCWGEGRSGRLGAGSLVSSSSPVTVCKLGEVTDIDVGSNHACAVHDGGRVACWGVNSTGQLGDGTIDESRAPIELDRIVNARQVAVGLHHTCVLHGDSAVTCIGSDALERLAGDAVPFGALGGTGGMGRVEVAGVDHPVELVSGLNHTCARTRAGELLCWGDNFEGQLGRDTGGAAAGPGEVPGFDATLRPPGRGPSIHAGDRHTCAVERDGGVSCWGNNAAGQLGDGTTEVRTGLVRVAGADRLSRPLTLGGGANHTCAQGGGRVVCWGSNMSGQLGDGNSGDDGVPPVDATEIDLATSVDGGDAHSCAVEGTTVHCWGHNSFGQLGRGTTTTAEPLPFETSTP